VIAITRVFAGKPQLALVRKYFVRIASAINVYYHLSVVVSFRFALIIIVLNAPKTIHVYKLRKAINVIQMLVLVGQCLLVSTIIVWMANAKNVLINTIAVTLKVNVPQMAYASNA